jgi:LPXTG-site transpeptidase (sortase) family protein
MTPPGAVTLAIRWLERALFVMGGVLALWCIFSVGRTYYYARLPVPPVPGRVQLPGDLAVMPSRPVVHQPRAWIARLEAPSVALSAFPGQPGNIGIAGHRDTIFRPLRRLRTGDPLTLTTSDRVFHYRVSGTKIVNPEDVYVLDPSERPVVTLVTCYPFDFIGHAPRRYIVRADLVGESARLEAGGPVLPSPQHGPRLAN